MLGITNYEIFLITGIILNLTPGPDTLFILGRSMAQGRSAGVCSALGINAGAVIHTILAAIGLSVILSKSILAFTILKYLGAMYLLYLGARSLLAKNDQLSVKEGGKMRLQKIFLEGMLTNVFNPKVALFFLAFLPQFIEPHNSYGMLPFLVLGVTFVVTGTIWCLIVAFFSSKFTIQLRNNRRASSLLNKASGLLFVGLGIHLLFTKSSN
ncbi:LysE family translocator [Ammoniphilus sp. CFH 90114]|uniref:LysE family translocator n=1 Tax=Ammoniphilus sp. CFH 90114 TaxID=2493665 RepID=UPI00100E45CC|nr:LysE family translocator [Ammoniphilus sp. CFH 90114]RXT14020.1 LysE family translocator [Ammoniphilus sp. CFH 90114]